MRDLSAESWIALVLIAAVILIPVTLALKDSPPAHHWRFTPSSVWGQR